MVVIKMYRSHIFIWIEGEDKLEGFLNPLNNFHPNVNFTPEKSKSSVNFWDVSVNIVDNKLETDLFCKPTDCHQFLHFTPANPFRNEKPVVYSQSLRIKRLCSSPLNFQKHLENLKTWKLERFCKRRYPQKVLDAQIRIVSEKNLIELFERPNRKETGVPLVVTDHPRFHNLNARIRKYIIFLYAEEKVKRVFTPAPFVSFLSGCSLRNHLVRAKVSPLIGEKSTFCCGRADVKLVAR